MSRSKIIRPVNSLIFISDRAGGAAPDWQDKQILFNENCISVACYPEPDGPTEVVLGTVAEVDPGLAAQFEGMLNTPSRGVSVTGVAGDVFLEMRVPARQVRIRIWLNHPRWADRVLIGAD